MDAIWVAEALVFLALGASLGSFLNVCSFRIVERESIVRPGSHCRNCWVPIRRSDNIPIISYILLKGRCRYCKSPISMQYPVVEGIMGVLCVLIAAVVGLDIRVLRSGPVAPRVMAAASWFILCFLLVLIAAIDYRTGIIPDVVSLPGIALGVLLNLVLWLLTRGGQLQRGAAWPLTASLSESLWGLGVGGGFFFVLVFASKGRWMGAGDIRLGALLGSFMGWKLTVISILIASLAGTVWFLPPLIRGKVSRKTEIRFGPLLSFGGIVSSFCGHSLMNWYLRMV